MFQNQKRKKNVFDIRIKNDNTKTVRFSFFVIFLLWIGERRALCTSRQFIISVETKIESHYISIFYHRFWPGGVNESPLEPKRKHMNIPLCPYLISLHLRSLFSLLSLRLCLSFPADRKCTPTAVIPSFLSVNHLLSLPVAEPITGEEDESHCTVAQVLLMSNLTLEKVINYSLPFTILLELHSPKTATASSSLLVKWKGLFLFTLLIR